MSIKDEVRVVIQVDHSRVPHVPYNKFVLNLKYIRGLTENLHGQTTISFITTETDKICTLPVLNKFDTIAKLICEA